MHSLCCFNDDGEEEKEEMKNDAKGSMYEKEENKLQRRRVSGIVVSYHTVKPVESEHSKIGKTKVF